MSTIQALYEAHKAKVEQMSDSAGLADEESESMILELIVLDKALMSEPATCIVDVGIMAQVAKYWRDDSDQSTLDGFDYAVSVAAAQFCSTEV